MASLPPALAKKQSPTSRTSSLNTKKLFTRSVKKQKVVEFTRSFAVMLQARLPLVQTLDISLNQFRKDPIYEVIESIARLVKNGKRLSEGMANYPKLFNNLYLQMVRVGEETGLLHEMMIRLATYMEKTEALKRKIQLALVYPGLILSVAISSMIFMLLFIVPTFASMFETFGKELPPLTQFVINLSDFSRRFFPLIVLFILGITLLLRYARQTPKGRYFWDKNLLRLPVFGNLLRQNLIAQFCQTLGTLLKSGVSLVKALENLEGAMWNALLEEDVRHMKQMILQGKGVANPAKQSGLFPPMVIEMMVVGEETAKLDEMLLHLADHYERQVDSAVETLTSVIEPILIILIGLIIGFLLVSLYLPIFELVNVVG